MARRQPKVHDARARLLEAGAEVFATKGYAAAGVGDITDRAGLTRGAFYYYFSSKKDIAGDLQKDLWRAAAKRSAEAFDPGLDTITNLKRAFEAHLNSLSELGLAKIFLREGFLDPTLEASALPEYDRGVDLLRALLEDAMANKEVIPLDPAALADMLTELFEVATFQVLRSEEPGSTLEVVHALLDGLRPS